MINQTWGIGSKAFVEQVKTSKIYDDYILFRTCIVVGTPTLRIGYILVASHTCRHYFIDISSTKAAVGLLSLLLLFVAWCIAIVNCSRGQACRMSQGRPRGALGNSAGIVNTSVTRLFILSIHWYRCTYLRRRSVLFSGTAALALGMVASDQHHIISHALSSWRVVDITRLGIWIRRSGIGAAHVKLHVLEMRQWVRAVSSSHHYRCKDKKLSVIIRLTT